jgi:hypothetical protein
MIAVPVDFSNTKVVFIIYLSLALSFLAFYSSISSLACLDEAEHLVGCGGNFSPPLASGDSHAFLQKIHRSFFQTIALSSNINPLIRGVC